MKYFMGLIKLNKSAHGISDTKQELILVKLGQTEQLKCKQWKNGIILTKYNNGKSLSKAK